MNWLSKIAGQTIRTLRAIRWGSHPPRDPAIASWWGAEDDDTGVTVNETTALQLTAVWRAVALLSNTVADLPMILYKRTENGGKVRAVNHPLFDLLHQQPNSYQTVSEFKNMLMGHMLLRGNGYAEIIPAGGKAVAELIPLNPDRVRPFWAPDNRRAYEYQPLNGKSRIILQDEMFHVMGYSQDGLIGLNPIEYHRRTLGITIGAEKYGGRFFKNNALPGFVLEYPGELGDKARQNLTEWWDARHRGVNRSHRPAILEEGMKAVELSITPEDAQYLETRKFQVTEIARMFGVPSYMLEEFESGSSFASIEQRSLDFVIYYLTPWLVRWEQAATRDLLTETDKKTHLVEFLLDALLRGDTKSRYDAYAIARQWGWLSVNDIRARENMNPVVGGDTYLVPLNMIPAQTLRGLWDEGGQDLLRTIVRAQTISGGGNGHDPATVEKEIENAVEK